MSQQTEDQGMNLPNPAEIAKTYAEVAQRASRLITQFMEKKAKDGVNAPSDELGVAKAFMDLSSRLMANPYKMAQTQMNMMWDYFSLWQNTTMKMMGVPVNAVAAPKKGDNRFKDQEWEEHFLFDFVKQSYLITARHLHDTVAGTEGLDEQTQQKVNFFTRQYIDALSPSNFAMTNPEVFRETVKSHGQNLIKGLNNLLHDVESGDGQLRIRMTDTSAFEMGKNVATTPGKVVFQNELFQLIQYNPTTPEQNKKPFLIVPPWINKYYILDLREKNSMVKWATDQGHTTFIMSWTNPDEKLAAKSFENYLLEGSLEAINQVCAHTGEDSVNLAGYCLGGTLTMTTLAYMAAKKDKRANSATFFTTMLDFSEPGELGIFLDEGAVSGPRKEDGRTRFPGRFGNGRHLQHAARQRPDLVLRGQQLPDGQGSVPVRPAVLELRFDPYAGRNAQLLPAQHVPGQPAPRTGWHYARRRQDRHQQGQDPVLLHLDDRRPHRTVEEHLHGRSPAVWQYQVRARRLRPYRRYRQSAGSQQVWLLDQ